MSPSNPASGRGTHEIRIGVWASEEQAQDVVERISRALCPDPEHDGPCEVPWSISVLGPEQVDEGEDGYEGLVEQARIEGTY
ncbi:hypothetical protein FHR75_002114 [Kineococcus radiotolerans]|uniref:Uncharacterized protein n=2 Tax=Kineococcus radiotolerans TaxID=131568 RepID=A6W408_KINRD|nr:hypothetical protein [Kineococcus radiotolerans]ABS01547.1 hypothetical protein Krad_0056 [Kineococcus radiotolerans SRS30216 = ATCC BAA-149]MBB2901326.1 hypothetical protein [Kineococcus radiotolerans]